MTSTLTSDQAIALLREQPEAYRTPESLRALAAQVDADASGTVTVLYGGHVAKDIHSTEVIKGMIAAGEDVRVIDKSQAARFLQSDDFYHAVAETYGLPDFQSLTNGSYRGPATDWLYNGKSGPWADASGRFADATKGEVRAVVNGAEPDRVFGTTEVPRILDNSKVTSVEGIPHADLLAARAARGEQAPFEMIVARAQGGIGKLRIAMDANGVPVKEKGSMLIDSRDYFADTPSMATRTPAFSQPTTPLEMTLRSPSAHALAGQTHLEAMRTPMAAPPAEPLAPSEAETAVRGSSGRVGTVGRVAGVAGAGLMVYDAYQTAQQYQTLSAKGNQFGADALLHQYEGRTAGGLIGGFAAGAAYGAVAGSESGPGALVTGAVGGVVGAFAGDKIATAYNEHQVNHQTGTNGVTYAYDKGQWTQTEHHLGLSSYDLPTIKSATIHAPADQISTLDYQRTTAVTSLALANPVTQDTKNITLDGTEWHASRGGWTKEVQQTTPGLPQADDFGRPITISEPADAKTAKQLDQLAANRQYNNAHYAESVSQAYVMDYYGKGWNKNGPLPEVVTQELKRPSETQIADPATGHTWTADGKGHFSREETTVGFDMPVTMTVKADGAELARVGKLQQEAMQSNAAYGSQLIADKYAQLQQTSIHQQAPVQPAPAATPDNAAVNPAASHTPPHVAEAPSAFFHEMSAKIDRFEKAMQAGDRTAVMKEVAHVYETPEWQASYGRARETAAKDQQQREHERAQNPRDPRDAGHPDHAMNQSIRKQVETLHERAGIFIGNQELDRLTASMANDARRQGMTRVDQVQFGDDKNQVIATQGGLHDMLSKHSVTNVQQAMQTPPEHAYQQMGQETQRQAQVQQNVQQQIAQSQQQGQSLGR